MNHIILKKVVDIKFENESSASDYLHKKSAKLIPILIRKLESLFDEYSIDNEVLQIEKLNIDVGRITLQELESATFNDKVIQKLKNWFDTNIAKDATKITLELSAFESWLFYLEYGYFKGSKKILDKDFIKRLEDQLLVDKQSRLKLKVLLIRKRILIQRLILQNSDAFLSSLIKTLIKEDSQVKIDLLSEDKIKKDRVLHWQNLFEKAIGLKEKFNPLQTNSKKIDDEDLISSIENNRIEMERDSSESEDVKIEQKDTSLYIHNAGLVIVHPFLKMLFEKLDLYENKQFVNDASRVKAVHLLNYLSHGNEKFNEHEMSLSKVMCGYPLSKPIQINVNLESEMLLECDSLLQAIVTQWGALGNVSNASLQEGFFNRDGKLEFKKGEWYLKVEKKTMDLLLDRLPWGMNYIKLPWVEEIIKVEWV